LGWSLKDSLDVMQHLTSSQIPTEQNRWRGANYGGYSNPTLDRLFDAYIGTLDVPTRQGLLADILKIDAADVASIHLNYDMATNCRWGAGCQSCITPGSRSPKRIWVTSKPLSQSGFAARSIGSHRAFPSSPVYMRYVPMGYKSSSCSMRRPSKSSARCT